MRQNQWHNGSQMAAHTHVYTHKHTQMCSHCVLKGLAWPSLNLGSTGERVVLSLSFSSSSLSLLSFKRCLFHSSELSPHTHLQKHRSCWPSGNKRSPLVNNPQWDPLSFIFHLSRSLFIPLSQPSFFFPFLQSFVFNILSTWAMHFLCVRVRASLSVVYSECIWSWMMSFREITDSSGFCTWVFYFTDFFSKEDSGHDMFLLCSKLHLHTDGHYL